MRLFEVREDLLDSRVFTALHHCSGQKVYHASALARVLSVLDSSPCKIHTGISVQWSYSEELRFPAAEAQRYTSGTRP